MSVLNTIHKRKSAIITAIIMLLLLLCIFFFGLKYIDPPIESGIAVNFGTSNVGSGNIQPLKPIKTELNPKVTEEISQEKIVEKVIEESAPDDSPTEDVTTQESEETIKIKKAKELKKQVETDKIAEAKAERKAKAEADRKQKEENDKKRKLDKLMGGLNTSNKSTSGGEANDISAGDKGSKTGDPNANGYYGNGGNSGNGDYQLGNRKALNRPKPKYECNEEGLIVVAIEVDRNGKVIKATPGVKGSTNTASCLLSQAKIAAMKTTWQADFKAGSKQIGIIKYRFSLSN